MKNDFPLKILPLFESKLWIYSSTKLLENARFLRTVESIWISFLQPKEPSLFFIGFSTFFQALNKFVIGREFKCSLWHFASRVFSLKTLGLISHKEKTSFYLNFKFASLFVMEYILWRFRYIKITLSYMYTRNLC